MKYESPEYKKTVIETEDIVTASSVFKITKTDTGSGKIQMDFSKLFG